MTSVSWSRRRFLAGTSAALAAPAALAGEPRECSWEGSSQDVGSDDWCPTDRCGESGPGFRESRVVCAHDGSLKACLNVQLRQLQIGGRSRWVRLYNGECPGPTLRCHAGDKLRLHLANELPELGDYPSDGAHDNKPHGFNTTNLHFHGLHVSPKFPSDDVFVRVGPGECADYCVQIPEDHAPGTHWYHAHKHGSTALQVSNGLSGALIIEERVDELAPGAIDRVWLLQELIGDAQLEPGASTESTEDDVPEIYTCNPTHDDFLVNGLLRPTLTLSAGSIERWRFINATSTSRGRIRVALVRCTHGRPDCDAQYPMHLIAIDGISFYGKTLGQLKVRERDMPPGGRADFLVQLPPGDYAVVRYPRWGVSASVTPFKKPSVLAFVRVEEIPIFSQIEQLDEKHTIPGRFPRYLEPFDEAEREGAEEGPHVEFQACSKTDIGRCDKPYCTDETPGIDKATFCHADDGHKIHGRPVRTSFLINGRQYDPDCIDIRVKLGSVQKWTLGNAASNTHPFHIHINPFYIFDQSLGFWIWQDTYGIPPFSTREDYRACRDNDDPWHCPVPVYFRFYDFAGVSVLHCHILVHEDLGMMFNFEVVGEGVGPCAVEPFECFGHECKGAATVLPSPVWCPDKEGVWSSDGLDD